MDDTTTTTPPGKANPALARIKRKQMLHATNRLRTDGEPSSVGEIIQSLTCLSRPAWISDLSPDVAIKRLGDKANLPLRHRNHAAGIGDTCKNHPDWERIRDILIYKQGAGYLFGLLGPRGTGKTQIAVNVGLHRIAIKWPVLYVKTMDIFLWIRSTYNDENLCELDALSEFLSPSLLIIDEAGERGETAFEDRMLSYLLDKRYDACLDTILIANLTIKAFTESVGPSIIDRIRETGSLIECNWESKRAAAREQFGNENVNDNKKGNSDE